MIEFRPSKNEGSYAILICHYITPSRRSLIRRDGCMYSGL